ncbi:MAG: hypothetical protein LAQ30_15575 [Acidobacteriia bacterium]|nr:hypothetical protein [Terriglobia bacterium]
MLEGEQDRQRIERASIHPDGRQIAYLGGEKKKEVWVLENFLPAAKAANSAGH